MSWQLKPLDIEENKIENGVWYNSLTTIVPQQFKITQTGAKP